MHCQMLLPIVILEKPCTPFSTRNNYPRRRRLPEIAPALIYSGLNLPTGTALAFNKARCVFAMIAVLSSSLLWSG